MKKILFITVLAAIFAACESNEPKAFSIKDTDMISIRPAASAANTPQKVKADDIHLSALEIVKQTTEISYIWAEISKPVGRSFAKEQRDTVSTPPKLLMWATDVIMLDGTLQTDFITATDVVLVHYELNTPTKRDTIAYIPNQVLRSAETAIRAAYETKDIEECYRAFNEAYTFTPITGAEWRALKANGQN
ncbi:MAG: hypothetical protein EOM47_06490 [Bacteroidia bacterium]|nr:hypothetical protein [Bacteroidia bacterium]